ncbi:META domain-containing protein [Photobacterium ganghwense]|uniref:META domain-containing protein n=1 Tax=Photobacterium ganghwense TaxID=320778 RepID=UPI0039EE2AC5
MIKKRYLTALALPVILAACSTTVKQPVETTMISANDLATHQWVLTKVDNKALELQQPFKAPTLQLNEELGASGHAGCNRYFGQAELKDGKMRIEKMGMTMMACQDPAMKLEHTVSSTLMEWSTASINGNELSLTGAEHNLTFTRTDVK